MLCLDHICNYILGASRLMQLKGVVRIIYNYILVTNWSHKICVLLIVYCVALEIGDGWETSLKVRNIKGHCDHFDRLWFSSSSFRFCFDSSHHVKNCPSFVELKRKTMNKRENQSTIKSNAIRGPWSGYQIKRGWCGKEKDGVHEGFKVVSPFCIKMSTKNNVNARHNDKHIFWEGKVHIGN